MKAALIISIALQAIISIIASAVDIKKESKLTVYGYFFVVFSIIAFGLNLWYVLASADEQNEFLIKLNTNDSTKAAHYDDKLDSNTRHTIRLLSIYGLKVDSTKNEIERTLSDSALNKDFPLIDVETYFDSRLKFSNDTIFYNLAIGNHTSHSLYKANIYLKAFYKSSTLRYIVQNTIKPFKSVDLPPNIGQAAGITMQLPEPMLNDTIYCVIKGDYLAQNGKKLFLNEIASLNVKEKKWYLYDTTVNAELAYTIRNTKF